MKKHFLLVLLLLLIMPFSHASVEKQLLGHILYADGINTHVSPMGVAFTPGKSCGAHYTDSAWANKWDYPTGASCAVCSAPGYNSSNPLAVGVSAFYQNEMLRKANEIYASYLSKGTIKLEGFKAYHCDNDSQYNIANVYFYPKATSYSLTVKSVGGGTAYIGKQGVTSITATPNNKYSITLSHAPGFKVTKIVDNGNSKANQFVNSTKYDVTMGTANREITVTFEAIKVEPKIEIRDKDGNTRNGETIKNQTITVKDLSTYLLPGSEDKTYYGKDTNRGWKKWSGNAWSEYLTYNDIYKNGNNSRLTDESFTYTPSENETSVAFQVTHAYEHNKPIIGNTKLVYAAENVKFNITAIEVDFNIFYTPTTSTTPQDVTDKLWSNSAEKLTVTLRPTNLSELDPSKINWYCYDTTIKVTKNEDGTATSTIPREKQTTFLMSYNNSPIEHWTQFDSSPILSHPDFEIKHGETPVTNTEWASDKTPQTVKLIPFEEYPSYYWEYKTPDSGYKPLPNNQANLKEPSFVVEYKIKYEFKLTVKDKTATHDTLMTPSPSIGDPITKNNIPQVGVTITSPKEVNIHNIPADESVRITPITITLKPILPEGLTINIDDWHWEVWLTGQNNLPDDSSKPYQNLEYLLLDANNYSLTAPDNYKVTHNFDISEDNQITYTNLSCSNQTLKIPFWLTERDVGRQIIFRAYARLVSNDGTTSNYDIATSYTLLIDEFTTPNIGDIESYKEYITSIDELSPELDSANKTPVFDSGTHIPFTADVSQTSSISVSANKDILANSHYKNSGSDSQFAANLELTLKGDYDDNKTYNIITIRGEQQNSHHSATQLLKIKPNWFVGEEEIPGDNGGGSDPDPKPNDNNGSNPGNSDESALRIISTRDLRWQSLFKNGALNWGLSTANGTTKPLLPNDISINGMKISPIKTGYAVEFTFDITKTFAEKSDHNVQIDVTFKKNGKDVTSQLYYQDTYGGTFKALDNYYKHFNLNNSSDKTKFNITETKHADGTATYKFLYYVPGTLKVNKAQPSAGDQLDVYFTIRAMRGNTEYFNYNTMAADRLYNGWNGWIFSYDLTKSNLQDVGYNAN